jgi:hypothetical protein
MRVRLITDHTHAETKYPAGAEVDLPDADARWLIATGGAKAEPITDNTRPAKKAATKE